jgi:hypothetical protein
LALRENQPELDGYTVVALAKPPFASGGRIQAPDFGSI